MILSARYFHQGISGCAGIKLSNLSIRCNHQMVTFRACAVNLYQATKSERGVPGDETNALHTVLVIQVKRSTFIQVQTWPSVGILQQVCL